MLLNTMNKCRCLTALFVLMAALQTARAQQTDSAHSLELDPVIVTADKVSAKMSQTGKVVDVVTREQLEKSGGKSLTQILNEQPGIIVSGAGSNPGLNKSIFIEGAGSGYALVLLDGVPLQDASSVNNSFDLRNLTLESIDRIEIVKGGQSVLYGSDAIAGVINIITKKTAGKPFAPSAQGSYGTNNTRAGAAGVAGSIKALTYNVGYAYYHTDGIAEATDTVPGTKNPRDGYTQHSFHANLDWQAAKGFSLSPFVLYSHYNGSADGGSFSIDTSYSYKLSNLQAGIRSLITVGKGQLHLVYAYNRSDRSDYDDSLPNLVTKANFYSDGYSGYEHYAEGYLSYPLAKGITIVGGADYHHQSTDQHSLDLYPDFTVPGQVDTSASSLPRDSAHYHQVALYAAATVKLPYGLYVDGGLRYNINSKYGEALVFNIDPSVTIAERVKLFVNVSSGYKTPSLYQLYSAYGNKGLQPEQSMSYAGGVEYSVPSKTFRIRATYFDRSIRDVIFFFTNPSTFASRYINQNKEHDHGVELEASWAIVPHLTLSANYTYVTGKVTDKSGEGGADTSYFNLLRIPRNSAGAALSYQVTKALFLSTNVQWQDKRQDLYYDYNTYADAQVTLHAFILWNAYAEYRLAHGRVRIFTDAQNLTNTRYMEIYGYNTLGFTLTGGVRFTL
jgi:vitamin B12 transporter